MGRYQPENGKTGKRYHIELSRTSAVFWAISAFVVLGWIFTLGVFAGRGLIPGEIPALEELKAQIAKLQQMVSKKDRAELEEIRNLHRDPKFAFFDELSAKKEEAGTHPDKAEEKTVSPRSPNKEKTRTTAVRPEEKAASPKPSNQQETRNSAVKPEEKPAPTKPPNQETARPSSVAGKYVVQVASVETEAKAKDMVGRLTRKGFPAYFYKVVVKGKTYFRVRCGIFKTEGEALGINNRLLREEKLTGFVHKIEGN